MSGILSYKNKTIYTQHITYIEITERDIFNEYTQEFNEGVVATINYVSRCSIAFEFKSKDMVNEFVKAINLNHMENMKNNFEPMLMD